MRCMLVSWLAVSFQKYPGISFAHPQSQKIFKYLKVSTLSSDFEESLTHLTHFKLVAFSCTILTILFDLSVMMMRLFLKTIAILNFQTSFLKFASQIRFRRSS